tara:strand:- start:1338 stop:1556 length:219 start_codon:yes stop_codon:yes gene_type:complete
MQRTLLGDWVELIFRTIGIKWIVKKIYGKKDCGCGKRKDKLNEMHLKMLHKFEAARHRNKAKPQIIRSRTTK